MTKTGTIVKAMQAVLLVTVLTPATVFAGPVSTRQMAAQTQDQPATGEVKRINRGLILGTAQAATNPNAQRPVEIPAIPAPTTTAPVAAVEAPKVDVPALPAANNTFETAAAPVATMSSSSIVTLPAPAPATDTSVPVTTNASTTTDAATAPASVAPVAPVITTEPTPTTVTTPAATTTAKVDTATSSTNTSSTKVARAPHQSRSRHHCDDSFDVGGFNVSSGNINRQLTKFINRSDVKSIFSQYGLN